MFAHLPIVGYSELKDYVVEESIATRWKALRGIERALLARERLDDLQMDAIVWCPYEDHRGVRPFVEQTFFSDFIKCGTDVRPYCSEKVLR